MSESMLYKWTETVDDRATIENFLDWMYDNGHSPPKFHSGREQALDKYFGIDRTELELERRALLNGEFK